MAGATVKEFLKSQKQHSNITVGGFIKRNGCGMVNGWHKRQQMHVQIDTMATAKVHIFIL